MATRIMYIERKDDGQTAEFLDHSGSARIGRVTFSKTMNTIYYNGKTFHKTRGPKHNYWEFENGDYYWISGCKKDGNDRLYGKAPIHIDDDVRVEYWTHIRNLPECVDIKIIR
jgi:hypothetical protein